MMERSFTNEALGEEIIIGPWGLRGILNIPAGAKEVVLFAHGSDSSRLSSRNQYVAKVLQNSGFATLLFDLLLEDEAANRENVFDISLLAQRLEGATDWLAKETLTANLKVGYFGASTGAAAALVAAARRGKQIFGVVSRGGRPDLAISYLDMVAAPTLLIVGGLDFAVIRMNERALVNLRCEKSLRIIAGATHLFSEPGTLEEVAKLASAWFATHAGMRSAA